MLGTVRRLRRISYRFRATWRARADRKRAEEIEQLIRADDPYGTGCSDRYFWHRDVERFLSAEEEEAGR